MRAAGDGRLPSLNSVLARCVAAFLDHCGGAERIQHGPTAAYRHARVENRGGQMKREYSVQSEERGMKRVQLSTEGLLSQASTAKTL